jgi:MYXO-CTERM domain-containing protein
MVRLCASIGALLFLTVGPTADALIVRHDVPPSDYLVAEADYPALVDLFGPGDCIGTLIHKSYLLTVAHCASDLTTGSSLEVNGVSHTIADIIIHPDWNDNLDQRDIALVRLEQPVTGVAPLPIYRGSAELGSVITLVGRGMTGTGLTGEAGGTHDGKLRRVTNVVSAADEQTLQIVFERAGEAGVTNLEGVGAEGDSGCPGFVEVNGVSYVAGLNSFSDAEYDNEVAIYGARDYQTRVSRYVAWLESHIDFSSSADPPDPAPADSGISANPVDDPDAAGCSLSGSSPEGGGVPLLLLALIALGLGRRRRRRAA